MTHAAGHPSEELAKALTALGRWQYGRAPLAPVFGLAARAVDVATTAGCARERVEALWLSGMSHYFAGRCGEATDQMRQAVEVAHAAGLTGLALETQGELAGHVTDLGEREEGRDLAERARDRALDCGLMSAATFNGEQIVDMLRCDGRLDEADRLMEQLRFEGLPQDRWEYLQADQLLARGDLAGALSIERATIARIASGVDEHMVDVVRQVDFVAAGRPSLRSPAHR